MLQEAGVVQKEPARAASTDANASAGRWWACSSIWMPPPTNGSPGSPARTWWWRWTDADGRILYARFFPQEGTDSPFAALESVVRNYGRFCELYTDRGSHFCQSEPAGAVADQQNGQVSRAPWTIGIRQILAYSPQSRCRRERAFGTIQGRLPQELRHNGITGYPAANAYLEQHFIPISIAASRSSPPSPTARSSNRPASNWSWCCRANTNG